MVVTECRIERKIEDRNAQRGRALGEDTLATVPQYVARIERGRAGEHADDDASALADPVVVDGVFEKESNAKDEGDHADAVHPGESDLGFELLGCNGNDGLRLQ